MLMGISNNHPMLHAKPLAMPPDPLSATDPLQFGQASMDPTKANNMNKVSAAMSCVFRLIKNFMSLKRVGTTNR